MSTVAAHGLRATLPARWEARVYLRERPEAHSGPPWRSVHPDAYGAAGESRNPVLHLANFALPPDRGDFGTGAVDLMGAEHAFVAVVEYDREEVGRPLFAMRGLPRPAIADFAPNALQRRLPGQLGWQRFCTAAGRPFCVYAVLGSRQHAARLVDEIRATIGGVTVDPPSHPMWSRPGPGNRPQQVRSEGTRR